MRALRAAGLAGGIGLWLAAQTAGAATLPNGDVFWSFATASYSATMEWAPGSITGGTATLTNPASGQTVTGTVSLANITDAPAGSADTLILSLTFPFQDYVNVLGIGVYSPSLPPLFPSTLFLSDADGVAFDGVPPGDPGYGGGQVPPANPPPLALFETATVSFPYYVTSSAGSLTAFSQNLTALPEPGVTALLLAAAGLSGLRRRR